MDDPMSNNLKNFNADTSMTALRSSIRDGRFIGQTAGLGRGLVHANIVILPKDYAYDFLRFCNLNPKPCPLLSISEAGEAMQNELGADIDIRTDVPAYIVYRHGQPVEEVTDIKHLWRDDLVTFALGCSFSFEEPIMDAGIALRHIEQGQNIPMFITNQPCKGSGPFQGNLVVTMRPLSPRDAIHAIEISGRYPKVHGAPIHIGNPTAIGIEDLSAPNFGDPTPIEDNEVPTFWACGVTPQLAIMEAKVPFCITHKPGFMLITDLRNQALSLS